MLQAIYAALAMIPAHLRGFLAQNPVVKWVVIGLLTVGGIELLAEQGMKLANQAIDLKLKKETVDKTIERENEVKDLEARQARTAKKTGYEILEEASRRRRLIEAEDKKREQARESAKTQ